MFVVFENCCHEYNLVHCKICGNCLSRLPRFTNKGEKIQNEMGNTQEKSLS